MSDCNSAIERAAKSLNMDKDFVEKVYKGYWKEIKEYIATRNFQKGLSEEEFKQIRPNINIPSLGKMCVTYPRYLNVLKRFEYIKKVKEKNNGNNES